MLLADYVINYLADRGVKHVFEVYGSAIGDLVDAFTRTDRIEYVCVMHEQAGAFAAETLTKVNGSLGVCLVTSGPGGTNLLTGIANAWYDSIPNLFITGQVSTEYMRRDPATRQVGFQENDIVSMAKPITKYAVMVDDPSQIRYEFEKAVYLATHGRPGPVLIDLPINIQKAQVDPEALVGFTPPPSDLPSAPELTGVIDTFLQSLNEAERPVLLVGGGIWTADALEEIHELGRVLKIPSIRTWNALDIIPDDYEYFRGNVGTYGGPGRNFAIQNADLLLTIGSRISGRITGGQPDTFARAAKKFIVDIDKSNLQPELQEVKGDFNIYADAKTFTRALIERAKEHELKSFDWWLDKTAEWLGKYDPVRPEFYETKSIVNPYVFIRKLSSALTSKDVIVADCGGNVVVTNQAFRTQMGQRLLSSNGNSPMGYSFAGAIGACVAGVEGDVICIIGDGGMTMNIQELQTLKTYDLPLKTFILNNHVYGITKAYQDTNFGGRYEASGPKGYVAPDFVKIAKAYGIETETINNNAEIEEKIKKVLAHDGPIVCDVNIHEWMVYEPRIFGWETPIEDMYPYLSREEFIKNLYIDPMPIWEDPVQPQRVPQVVE